MAKAILSTALIVMLHVLVGCGAPNSGRGQILPPRTLMSPGASTVETPDAGEVDLVEAVANSREVYRQSLWLLRDYYGKVGNHTKSTWAQKELAALDSMPQYKYIVEAQVLGSNLKATSSILEADYMFREALELEKKAGVVIKNENLLRLALDKYNRLIAKHPSSDKIDDAAYRSGGIYEHFKDYKIAILYYQRTYQWDPHTVYPARFREGWILDTQFHDREKALAAYEEALKHIDKGEHHNWKKYAERRVLELTKSPIKGK
jgi:tetratricopeptide (TPR) repeat protein